MLTKQYYQNVASVLDEVATKESVSIQKAGQKVAETIKADGLIHVFGCGHSHMIAEELFYRAGGIAPIDPIFDTTAMLHEGAQKSSSIERMSGLAKLTLSNYKIESKDILLVASNSGINPYPIEMALEAKKKGAFVIAITSEAYQEVDSRQEQGLHLADVSDLIIYNHVPYGDASVKISESGLKSGPISSISAFFIANSIVLAACESLQEEAITPPIFVSGNMPQGDNVNKQLVDIYKYRIKHL